MKAPVGTTYYDKEGDLFLRKTSDEDGVDTWHAYLPEHRESIPEDEVMALAKGDDVIAMGMAGGPYGA